MKDLLFNAFITYIVSVFTLTLNLKFVTHDPLYLDIILLRFFLFFVSLSQVLLQQLVLSYIMSFFAFPLLSFFLSFCVTFNPLSLFYKEDKHVILSCPRVVTSFFNNLPVLVTKLEEGLTM